MRKKFYRTRQNKISVEVESVDSSAFDIVGPDVSNHELKRRDSTKLSAILAGGVLATTASLIGYSYQRKRKKKQQTAAASLNQQHNLGEHSETEQPEEVEDENNVETN